MKKKLVVMLALLALLAVTPHHRSIALAGDVINSGSTMILELSFFDENGHAVIPTSLVWREVNSDGTEVVPATTVIPGSSIYDIVISAAHNAMVNATEDKEVRIVALKFLYASDKQGTAEYRYTITNLRHLP